MKDIVLSCGTVCWISDEDYCFLSQWSWQLDGGRASRKNGTGGSIKMHSVIAERMRLVGEEIDHKDRNALNNQRENLRTATHQQNLCNRSLQKNSTTGYKGVSPHRASRKFQAKIQNKGTTIFLGLHDTAEKAAMAYNRAAKRLHGEFAVLNVIPNENIPS